MKTIDVKEKNLIDWLSNETTVLASEIVTAGLSAIKIAGNSLYQNNYRSSTWRNWNYKK